MIKQARNLVKEVLKDYNLIDLDTKNVINNAGNYLVFNGLNKLTPLKIKISFSIYLAIKTLKNDDGAYNLMDDIYKKIIDTGLIEEKVECEKIDLFSFENNLFIYRLQINITGEYK